MDEKPRKTIEGKWTNEIPVGFCIYGAHKGYITIGLLKKHKCERKHCKCLRKIEHPYWDMKERKKREKKIRKRLFELDISPAEYDEIVKHELELEDL